MHTLKTNTAILFVPAFVLMRKLVFRLRWQQEAGAACVSSSTTALLPRYLEHGAGSLGVTPLMKQLATAVISKDSIPDLHHNTASLRCVACMHPVMVRPISITAQWV